MPKLDEQISTLQVKLQQLKLRQQRTEARKRALSDHRERKEDIRRKILLGGIVLQKLAHGEIDRGELMSWLEPALRRPADRALFGLPPLPAPSGGGGVALQGDAQPE